MTLHLEERRPFLLHPLAWAMLESYVDGCRPVPKQRVLEFLIDWTHSPSAQDDWSTMSSDWKQRYYEPTVDEALGLLADTGLYMLDDASLRLTPLGDVFVTAWLRFLERRE